MKRAVVTYKSRWAKQREEEEEIVPRISLSATQESESTILEPCSDEPIFGNDPVKPPAKSITPPTQKKKRTLLDYFGDASSRLNASLKLVRFLTVIDALTFP